MLIRNESNYNSLTPRIFFTTVNNYLVILLILGYVNIKMEMHLLSMKIVLVSYKGVDVDYESANFVYSELSKLIGKVPFNDLNQYLSLSHIIIYL